MRLEQGTIEYSTINNIDDEAIVQVLFNDDGTVVVLVKENGTWRVME